MSAKRQGKPRPPYVSYRTFQTFLDSLRQGIPARIDRSVWGGSIAGSTGVQLMATLRFLGLLNHENRPTNRLAQLVQSEGAEQRASIRTIVESAYPFLFDGSIDLQTATAQQLREKFGEQGAGGDVTRKCITFFVSIATAAGIPLSPYIREGTRARRPARSAGTPTETRAGGMPTEVSRPTWEEIVLSKFPAFDPSWPDEIKQEWWKAFDQLLQRGLARREHSHEDEIPER